MEKRDRGVIPAALRRPIGIEEGSLVVAEGREEGVLIGSTVTVPLKSFTPERRAKFLVEVTRP